jgi:uncharacterized protein YdeI (YjbR/CyaY-like superfamily)
VDVGDRLRVESIDAWHDWLVAHHADRREVWLVNDRKGPARRTPDYEELLDEAACHGWVDVMVRGLDETRFLMRWVPRKKGGNWTPANRDRARRMHRAGRMTPAGIDSLPDDLRAELFP